MIWRLAMVVLFAACVKEPGGAQGTVEPAGADALAWVEQFGQIAGYARHCVDAHPGKGASVIGVRTLATGELAFMTRTEGTVVACVYDGRYGVVLQEPVGLRAHDVEALPRVTLLGEGMPASEDCRAIREVRWNTRLIGWVSERTCGGGDAQ